MERKDVFFLLVLAGAGAYAVHANWDKIHEKLGLGDMYPGRIKAIQLAKEAISFEEYTANWAVLRDRQANGEIKVQGEPWDAVEIKKPRYRVTCTYIEKGARRVHRFTVDVGSSSVVYEGLDDGKAAPR
jgi:hypothetical protein